MTAWRRLARMRPAEGALLAGAALLLLRIRLALWLLPWRRVLAIVKPPRPEIFPRIGVDRLERAVKRASRVVPRATCLTQALALGDLLSRHGYASTIQIGVRKDDGRFSAHAWVECAGIPLLASAAEVALYARFLTWTAAQPDLFR